MSRAYAACVFAQEKGPFWSSVNGAKSWRMKSIFSSWRAMPSSALAAGRPSFAAGPGADFSIFAIVFDTRAIAPGPTALKRSSSTIAGSKCCWRKLTNGLPLPVRWKYLRL